MATDKNNFEIGRGAKLIPMEYWHQYVLGIDLTETNNIFVVSEVGKSAVLYQKKLSLQELLKNEWDELLSISETKSFINELKLNYTNDENLKVELTAMVNRLEKDKELLNGNWISIEEHGNLNYRLSNMVEASTGYGKVLFSLNLDSSKADNCNIGVPVRYYSPTRDGYYAIINGRFQLSKNKLLIWANEIFPNQIAYSLSNGILTLELYEREIKFTKE